jgi:SAM-dependent methyltransferase
MEINTKISTDSWSSIDLESSKSYLHYYSKSMKQELSEFISSIESPKVLDIGCGNAQIYPILKSRNTSLKYFGLDISKNLLEVAKSVVSSEDVLIECDIYKFLDENKEKFTMSIFGHMIECTESPDFLISKSSNFSDYISILWYDYPKYDYDISFINNNPHSKDEFKPYIRRKIGRDYWEMILKKNNLKMVHRKSGGDNDILEVYKKY